MEVAAVASLGARAVHCIQSANGLNVERSGTLWVVQRRGFAGREVAGVTNANFDGDECMDSVGGAR